jgi:hypothetical protein
LHGAADAAFRMSLNPQEQIVVECKKQKDVFSSDLIVFNRREVHLRIGDADDKSYVLDLEAEGDDAAPLAKPQAATEQSDLRGNLFKILRTLSNMYQEYGENLRKGGYETKQPRVEFKEWRQICMSADPYKRADNFNAAARKLHLRGYIEYDENKKFVYPIELLGDCKE